MGQIRTVRESDAVHLIQLLTTLDHETQSMMLEPGERQTTVEQQQRRIQEILASENSALLVAEDEGALVGFLGARGGDWRRNRHSAYLVVGILQSHAGQGIGRRLFEMLIRWAQSAGLHRLELTVMTHNERAIALYQKMGFVIEGTKRHSLLVNGQFVDEYQMAKMLPVGE